MTEPLLTAAAARHVARLLTEIAPFAGRLDRRFRVWLRKRGYNGLQMRAFQSITPSAACRLGSFRQFREQAEYHGRRLARLNVPPDEARETLRAFDGLLEALVGRRFEPAREQLGLATVMALQQAFYQVREAESQAFFDLYRAESEAAGLDDLLQRFVRILTRTFHARTGRLLLLDRPPRGKLAGPLYVERGRKLENLIADLRMRGRYASYWSFPMRPAAVLQFGFVSQYPWLPREAELLRAAAERCEQAIERARLREQIRRLEAEARRAEEEERRRIGRELHDEAGQSLLALRLQLEMMEREAPQTIRPRLAEARILTEHTVEELRRIVAALSPAVLDRLGLLAAIRQLAARFRKIHPAEIRLRLSRSCEGLSPESQAVIYRVTQESLQNIAKHSQATQVNILLRSTDKNVRLSVSDNGVGFAAEAALSKPMSFGLAGMRERARLLAGELTIRSAPGKGAAVVLELPQDSAPVKGHDQNSCLPD